MENTFIPRPDGHTTLRLQIYRPTSLAAQTPVLLWIHGGGYLIGRLKQDNESCAYFVRELGWTMIPLDYRLASKYLFPSALDDCYFALLWATSHSAQLGVDPQRIAIRGASAGCGLAAALAQSAHDRWEIDPVLQCWSTRCRMTGLCMNIPVYKSRQSLAAFCVGRETTSLSDTYNKVIALSEPPHQGLSTSIETCRSSSPNLYATQAFFIWILAGRES